MNNTYGKVLILNGSPHEHGTTRRAIDEVCAVLRSEGYECEIRTLGALEARGCRACGACRKLGRCVIDDCVNELASSFADADGIILASPVYYAAPNGAFLAILNRLFYSTGYDKTMKVGAAIVAARRGGCTASFDVLNKYFSISGMPVASSYYWDQIHGTSYDEAGEDLEGVDTMRSLGKNMAFLMKAIRDAKEKYGEPKREKKSYTNFIR
ncbi:MAG: flavodoxin family protein [Clostridia bacterium]|nr:flavodoxin family protein [Clostridia bacterium]